MQKAATGRLLGRAPQPAIGSARSARSARSLTPALVVCARRARASKADDDAGASDLSASAPPAPYGDALLAREYELWQRQAAMYERLLEQADHEQQRFAEERLEWKATEAALRQEAAELRAQLLYVLAQLNSGQAGGGAAAAQPGAAATAASSTSSYMASSQQAAIAAREPAAALASTSFGSAVSPAEQVKAVVDAMKAGAGGSTAQPPPPAVAPSSVSSSSVVSPSAAWPAGSNSELPSYAVDLAAAVAAVDTTDVLKGVGMFELQERRAAVQAEAAASSLAATPVEEPGVAPPVEQPVAAPPQPAAAEADAEASHGPPPPLTLGADDIFWVNQLHTALVDLGYFPGDDDIDVFFFGEGTMNALMTMQCCEGLPETGITDEATWVKLLGPELQPKATRDLTADMMLNVPGLSILGGNKAEAEPSSTTEMQQPAADAPARPAYAELFSAAFSETVQPNGEGSLQDVQQLTVTDTVAAGGKVVSDTVAVSQTVELGAGSEQVSAKVEVGHKETYTEWPVLMDGDGGREVHALHVALERAGYYPSEDDMRWWIFGDGTMAALKTCQACNSYPESGVCDAATWRFLLGPSATPADLLSLHTGDSADEDLSMQSSNRVWLMGEQRWEDRSRVHQQQPRS